MFVIKERQLKKILRLPRYVPGALTLGGRSFKYCDSRTMVHGYNEIFKKQVYAFNPATDHPLIIDCGSNIGLSIFYFKVRFRNAEIIAFEADKDIFGLLESNIREFEIKDVRLYNSAVWFKDGYKDFYKEGGFSGRIPKKGDPVNSSIETVNLAKFINSKIDLLKIDIEGAETLVVKSIESKLSFVDRIFIEYHSHTSEPQDLQIILEVLSDNGFRYFIKEAYVSDNPFIKVIPLSGMDLQLNIYAIKQQ